MARRSLAGWRHGWAWAPCALVGLWLSACAPATPEPIDATHLSGRWEYAGSGETEWFDFAADGTFHATIQQNGFLQTTLSQGTPVTLKGRWALSGSTITLEIEQASDPALSEMSHTYEIEQLTDRSMVTRDAGGASKTLHKTL